MIIERPRETSLINRSKWVLIYGRRKTGKTFIVENFTSYDSFYFVKRDRTIIEKGPWRDLTYETFRELVIRDISQNKTVVIDEFHRLGDDLLDIVHALPKKGRLVLISSTLHMARRIVDSYSPILGKLSEVRVDLIDLRDILKVRKTGKESLEIAAFLREPLLLDLVKGGTISEMVSSLKLTAPALLGEIFIEEDRKISSIYEGIIRSVASGRSISGEISSHIFSKRLIDKDDPSLIQQYLSNLVDFGILKKEPVWKKNRMIYSHVSPLLWTYCYLDEHYGFANREVGDAELSSQLSTLIPHIMEDAIRNLIASSLGKNVHLHQSEENEIDGVLTSFKAPQIVLEVKWKKTIKTEDIRKAEKNLQKISAKRRILIVPSKKDLKSDMIEIAEIKDFL